MGSTVKNSIQSSDVCVVVNGQSPCEVPNLEILHARSDAKDNAILQNLQNLLAQNDYQFIQCSGTIQTFISYILSLKILEGCKKSETVDELVAQDIQNSMFQNIANMGISGRGGKDGLVSNFNYLTSEELA